MDKKTKLLSKKIAKIRGWIQAVATLLTNIHIPNLFKGNIYQGKIKTVCVPGLNCYSCPADLYCAESFDDMLCLYNYSINI